MIRIWQLLQFNVDYILFGIILIVVIILFIQEFELMNPRSWLILLGLSTLGVVMIVRAYKKNRLLAELEERENELEVLKKKYRDLLEKHKISKEHYEKAKEELDEAKKKAARDILEAEGSFQEELKKIDEEYQNITPFEMIKRSKELLKSKSP